MFTTQLMHIYTKSNLQDTFSDISSNTKGLDEIGFKEFKSNLSKNIDKTIQDIEMGRYSPEPLKQIEIDKPDSKEKRPIALSSIKDKLVQKVLYNSLNDYFDKSFSNKSYAYRKGKSFELSNRSDIFVAEELFI